MESSCPQNQVTIALKDILATREFSRSESLSRLLEYVVVCALEGREEALKEYNLGVDVFRRGENFDPRLDNIVRVQARKLRLRLADYYSTPRPGVRIEMAPGSYVPVFRLPGEISTATPESGGRSRYKLWATIAAMTVLGFLAGFVSGSRLQRERQANAGLPRIPVRLIGLAAAGGDMLETRAASLFDRLARERLSHLARVQLSRSAADRGFTIEGSARRTGDRITLQLHLSGGAVPEDRGVRFAITVQDETEQTEALTGLLAARMAAGLDNVLKGRTAADWPRAAAGIADAREDFRVNGDQPAAGPWTYGWEQQLSGPLHSYQRMFNVKYWGVDVAGWSQSGEGPQNGQHCCPFVARNISGQDIREQTVGVPASKLFFHPGPNGEYSVVRWKNKDVGRYTIEARFSSLAFVSVDAHVVKNGAPLMEGFLDGRGVWHDFMVRNLRCEPDNSIDFALGFGADHSYVSDSTGLEARITPAAPLRRASAYSGF